MKKKVICTFLCLTMCLNLFSCGKNEKEDTAVASVKTEEGRSSTIDCENNDETEGEQDISESEAVGVNEQFEWTEKQDFYLDANQAWFEEMGLDPCLSDGSTIDYFQVAKIDEAKTIIDDALIEVFEQGFASSFEDDDPMYKYQLFYDQLEELANSEEKADQRICEIIDTVESVKNLNGVYELMLDEDYSLFNHFFTVKYVAVEEDGYGVKFSRKPLCNIYTKSEEDYVIITEGISSMLQSLSYEEDIARRMATNAVTIDSMIQEVYQNPDLYDESWYDEKYDELNTKIPFMDILTSQHYAYIDLDNKGKEEYFFFLEKDYISFLDELFVKENLQMIKDYYAVSALEELFRYANDSVELAYYNITNRLWGIMEASELYNDYYALSCIESLDKGVLAHYYTENLVDQNKITLIHDLFETLKKQMYSMMNDVEWMSFKTREKYRFKIKNMKLYIGSYEYFNQYEDMEICDNVVDTAMSMMKSNREFEKRLLDRSERYPTTDSNLLACNAFTFRHENTIVISTGLLEAALLLDGLSYEEQLGSLGVVLAHEMGHGFDRNGYYFDLNGKCTDFLSEEDNQTYVDHLALLSTVYDGQITLHGNTCDGNMSFNENFCDYVGVSVCLNVLSEMDNPSYEDFFVFYAQWGAEVYAPGYELFVLREDSHLPHHERVNIGLSQFEEFYETYSLDETYGYYMPEEERYHFFE